MHHHLIRCSILGIMQLSNANEPASKVERGSKFPSGASQNQAQLELERQTSAMQSPVGRVFGTYELLERVLSQSDCVDIIRCQRVSCSWVDL